MMTIVTITVYNNNNGLGFIWIFPILEQVIRRCIFMLETGLQGCCCFLGGIFFLHHCRGWIKVNNKKSRIYGTSDLSEIYLSIYQLC